MEHIDSDPRALPVGTKHGCLTIIGGPEEYDQYCQEKAQKEIAELLRQREEYLQTGTIAPRVCEDGSVWFSGFTKRDDPVAEIDKAIAREEHWKQDRSYRSSYKVRCKCGNTFFLDRRCFSEKLHRYCDLAGGYRSSDSECGLRAEQKKKRIASAERIKDKCYDEALPYTVHESLEILGYGDDKEIQGSILHNHRRLPFFTIKRTYRCRCYLCGEEHSFYREDFNIQSDDYGPYAYDGYYSKAHCDCHPISSFQWRTIDILRKHGVTYRVEISFDDLVGVWGRKHLRYDFGLYSHDGVLFALLECQGEQHYSPVEEFGGQRALHSQEKNDALKRQYAAERGIPLIEIPYTCNTYEKEKAFLKDKGII